MIKSHYLGSKGKKKKVKPEHLLVLVAGQYHHDLPATNTFDRGTVFLIQIFDDL